MAEIGQSRRAGEARQNRVFHLRRYERQLEQACANLVHVTAAIRIFEAAGNAKDMRRYVDAYRVFKRDESIALCKEALVSGPNSRASLPSTS